MPGLPSDQFGNARAQKTVLPVQVCLALCRDFPNEFIGPNCELNSEQIVGRQLDEWLTHRLHGAMRRQRPASRPDEAWRTGYVDFAPVQPARP